MEESPSYGDRAGTPRRGAGRGLVALVALAALAVGEGRAQDRLIRRFTADQGLAVPPILALAQDRTHFLWIGTVAGLYRFDGIEFRRWAPDRVAGAVVQLAAAPDGRVAAQVGGGEVFEATSDGVTPLPPPPGGWPAEARGLAYDAAGRLWSVAADGAPARREDGGWAVVPRSSIGGEAARRVLAAEDGGVLVVTDAGLWQIPAAGAPPRRRFAAPLVDALSLPDGRLVVLTLDRRVIELTDGRARDLVSAAAGRLPAARPIMLAERYGTIWVSMDRFLVALRPGGAPVVIGRDAGLDSGGPLLVDHEGSLWVGGFAALFQLAEPETGVWNDRSGLPGPHARFVARSGDVLWVTTWQGTGRVARTGTGLVASTLDELGGRSRPCADATGVVWLATAEGVVRVRGDRIVGRRPARAEFTACAVAPGPGLWIGTDRGLLRADPRAASLSRVAGLPFGAGAEVGAVLEDRAGRLWIASGDRACHAPAAAVLAGGGAWACETLPGATTATSFLELDDGSIWASTMGAGVLAHRDDGWRPLPANAGLASRNVFVLARSPAGGVWIAGHGILQRVLPGGPGGWEVIEAPGSRNGLLSIGGGDILEDDDGALWIATSLGLARVPARARFAPADPPRVVLVDARVDAQPVALDAALVLPARRNRLELRFAALSFREPDRVRYQVRLAPDAPWIDTRGQPWFRWVELPAGRYLAEVRASLDGRRWSAEPARFAFRVLPPWYRTTGALALFATASAAALWAAYRARLAYLVGLERQRTRIAMDLHDELGSGLGSIGILAGLLAAGRPDAAQRGRIATEIAGTAEELGRALADIVWSLDPRAATLEELVDRLAGHGARLFAGDEVEFRIHPPREWPAAELPLTLRRNVLLIGLEALHNAARHARARRVSLGLARRGRAWELAVTDDGVGIDPALHAGPRRGRGLPGMRRRAEEIGADIEWRTNPGGGTTVALRFTIPGGAAGRARSPRRQPRRQHDDAGA